MSSHPKQHGCRLQLLRDLALEYVRELKSTQNKTEDPLVPNTCTCSCTTTQLQIDDFVEERQRIVQFRQRR